MKKLAFAAAVALLFGASCTDQQVIPTDPTSTDPILEILDQAHNGGMEGFLFLPPVVAMPDFEGAFDATLSPVVTICSWVNDGCSAEVAVFDMSGGPGGETVGVSATDEHYKVNWHTDEFSLSEDVSYRILVTESGVALGHADVDVVNSGNELKNVDTDEFIALKDGRTLPIKFRIEQMGPGVTANAGSDQTVEDTDASGDEVVVLDGSLSDDPDGTIVSYTWYDGPATGTPIATGVSPSVTLAVGTHTITLVVEDDDGQTSSDEVTITVEAANQAPSVSAGSDQTVEDTDASGDEVVVLDGSLSDDPDGTIVSYTWYDGPATGTPIATGVSPSVTLAVGTHTITLVVEDDDGQTSSDEVTITVEAANQAPSVSAGSDQTVEDTDASGDEVVVLDGSLSDDPDGTIVSYTWYDGPATGTPIATGVSPSVTLAVGTHTITLVVEDDDGQTSSDEVTITVEAANQAPSVSAGSDQTVEDTDASGDEVVVLDGSLSDDPDGTIVSYTWYDGPATGTPIATGVSPSVTLAVGTHTITLVVEDDDGQTSSDEVTITVEAANQAPSVSAGSDQTVEDTDASGDEVVVLDGSLSDDPDGTIVSYTWYDGPATGTPIATGVSPSVTLAVGTHTITLVVEDDDGQTSSDEVTITVEAANQAPSVSAGSDQTVEDTDASGDEVVVLDGSLSDDPDGTIVSYTWYDGPATGTPIATGVSPSVTLAVGTHTITLVVEDDDGQTSSDEVTITIETPTGPSTCEQYQGSASSDSKSGPFGMIAVVSGNTLEGAMSVEYPPGYLAVQAGILNGQVSGSGYAVYDVCNNYNTGCAFSQVIGAGTATFTGEYVEGNFSFLGEAWIFTAWCADG